MAEREFVLPGNFEGWFALEFDAPLELGDKDPASDADRLIVELDENRAIWWGLSQEQGEVAEMVEHSHHDTCWHGLGTMGAMRFTPTILLGPRCR